MKIQYKNVFGGEQTSTVKEEVESLPDHIKGVAEIAETKAEQAIKFCEAVLEILHERGGINDKDVENILKKSAYYGSGYNNLKVVK